MQGILNWCTFETPQADLGEIRALKCLVNGVYREEKELYKYR